ncbi:MAG TPA: hypothetical protein VNH11_20675 [Pirellulales bacterium]|nr:hypothetical protein [Pirellulales bacterium]
MRIEQEALSEKYDFNEMYRTASLFASSTQEALSEKYDFNEPWDGPHNRLLAPKMPEVYRR